MKRRIAMWLRRAADRLAPHNYQTIDRVSLELLLYEALHRVNNGERLVLRNAKSLTVACAIHCPDAAMFDAIVDGSLTAMRLQQHETRH